MAEDKGPESKEGQTEAKKKKSPVLLIAIIGLVLILLSGGGVFAWKHLISTSDKKGKVKKVVETEEIGPIYPLETFIANLADADSQKYLKVTIQLEMDNVKLGQELEKRIPQIRDTIIGLLTVHTYSEMASYEGKVQLRSQIMNRINRMLIAGSIKRVYFTEFVIQ